MSQAPYSLLAELEKVKSKGKPPIHLWNPDTIQDIDMEICADGTWNYLGTPIERPRLIHLFASVMRIEDGQYFLVTPVEKCRIRVQDVPFQIVLMTNKGEGDQQEIKFTTNMNESVSLGREHPLRVEIDADAEETALYVMIRDGLEARINRNVYYQLTDLLVQHEVADSLWHGVWSQSEFSPVIESNRL
ncbi:MAG: hypothetical protein ACI82A_001595 [Candidatus Azotimanducaceae bacterium]|jgi:hypothetical protein